LPSTSPHYHMIWRVDLVDSHGRRRCAAGGRGNADAERVLARIRQKLDGYEDGELLSVSGQVRTTPPMNPETNERS
jgi:hypothetical protein